MGPIKRFRSNRKMTKKQKEDYNSLTGKEKKIHNAIMGSFPSTNPDAAYNKAIEGGCVFQYNYR